MNSHIAAVSLDKAFRLLNHGPTVLLSVRAGETTNVMPAAWVSVLDFAPPKVSIVIDRTTATIRLVEQQRRFVIQVPTARQLSMVYHLGTSSLDDDPTKLEKADVRFLANDESDQPFVEGCAAWLSCELIAEPHIEDAYDLFIGEITHAWADTRVFRDGRWRFEETDTGWRTLHHVSGGHFYAIGDALVAATDATQGA